MIKKFTFILILLTSSFVFSQASEWEWQNPVPNGITFNDLVAISADEVMLFGHSGAIQKTVDGGASWTVLYVDPSYREIEAAFFVDALNGYICGNDGLIMKTNDGGASWANVDAPNDERLYDIAFVNPDTGYAVGSNGTIWKTTDGGANWEASVSAITKTIYSIYAVAADNIYIGATKTAEQNLIRSTDEGATWNDVTPASLVNYSSIREMSFLDANTGWLSCQNGDVFYTVDGGANWNSTPTAVSVAYSVFFYDALNGYVTNNDGSIFKTTDGGVSWTSQEAAIQSLYKIGGVVNGTVTLYATGKYGTILKSVDDGATWTPLFNAVTQYDARAIDFMDANLGYAGVGTSRDFGYMLKTTDGGNTWQQLEYNLGGQVYAFDVVSENVWYVGRSRTVNMYKTTDGGLTYEEQATPATGSTKHFYDVGFIDENIGYASRSNGEIMKTTDGVNWESANSQHGTKSVYSIAVLDAQTVISVGSSALAYKTTDGGENWTQLNTGIAGSYFTVEFFDDKVGYIAGYSSPYPTLSKTVDGGDTWTPVEFPSDFDKFGSAWGIGFANQNSLWLTMLNGDIIYTEDGGATWSEYDKLSSNVIYDISIVGGDIWASGSGGTIMKGSVPMSSLNVEPQILSVVDIPEDQGGKVRLAISASSKDVPQYNEIQSYTVWREKENGGFDALGSFNAVQSEEYYFVAPTLGDSTAEGILWSTFKVSAHSVNPNVFYYSNPMSGYSIDNIAPGAPAGLKANPGENQIIVEWNANSEKDFQYFAVYRSTEPDFNPAGMEPVYTTDDTSFVDTEIELDVKYYYRISAFDYAGNESVYSEAVSGVIVGVETTETGIPDEYILSQNYPNPFNPSTTIKYGLPHESSVKIVIYNSLGEIVTDLVNAQQNAGYYNIVWRADNLSSGIYFYSVKASPVNNENGFLSVRKMMLIK